MIDLNDPWLIRIAGATGGSVLALIYFQPRTRQGFVRRAVAGVFFGSVMARYTQEWARFPQTNEGLFEAAYITGFLNWWLMGALKRVADAWKAPSTKADQED